MPATDNKASLGCGTLILIALIVMIFGNSNGDAEKSNKQISDKLQALQSEIGDLKSELNQQSAQLKKMEESLSEINERSKKPAPQPRPRVVSPATPEAPLLEN